MESGHKNIYNWTSTPPVNIDPITLNSPWVLSGIAIVTNGVLSERKRWIRYHMIHRKWMVTDPKSRTTTEGDTESPIIAEFLLIAHAYTHCIYSVFVAQARGRLLLRLQSPTHRRCSGILTPMIA